MKDITIILFFIGMALGFIDAMRSNKVEDEDSPRVKSFFDVI